MKAVYLCLCMLAAFCFPAAALPADCSQVIVGSADGWNSSHVQLSLLEKGPRGWVMVKGAQQSVPQAEDGEVEAGLERAGEAFRASLP